MCVAAPPESVLSIRRAAHTACAQIACIGFQAQTRTATPTVHCSLRSGRLVAAMCSTPVSTNLDAVVIAVVVATDCGTLAHEEHEEHE